MIEGVLDGRVAIVTGAGKGIGAATAQELARRGAVVVLAARTEDDIERVARNIRDGGGRALPVPTDVTDQPAVQNLTDTTLRAFGRLDILVNSAGSAVFETVLESDPELWWRTVETNLRGMYLCAKSALPVLVSQKRGHIVNVLSIAARTPFSGSSAYCASKAAGLMLTRVLAAEVRSHGIRVTALLPGATRTPLWDGVESPPDRSKMIPPERVAETIAFAVSQPEDVATDEIVVMPPLGVL